jgi:hypothetical protein
MVRGPARAPRQVRPGQRAAWRRVSHLVQVFQAHAAGSRYTKSTADVRTIDRAYRTAPSP